MAEITEKEVVERTETTTYYVCDRCMGDNHERTKFKDTLNRVVFGPRTSYSVKLHNNAGLPVEDAAADPDPINDVGVQQSTSTWGSDSITGDHVYLLCDECYDIVVEEFEVLLD